jgi:3-phenylpropionate/trans-cinnamate dioxygenase ferredoxin subunit
MEGEAYIDVAGIGEIPEGYVRVFDVNDIPIAICRMGDKFYAVEATCSHDDYRFDGGHLVDGEIECPQHGARFDIQTGEVRRMPAVAPVKTFPTRVDSGRILVRIEEEEA